MKNITLVGPSKVLDMSTHKDLGRGNLGVFIARAGVGKTACLIHMGLDRIFRNENLVHVSLEESPEKVASYYSVIYQDVVAAMGIEHDDRYKDLLDSNRMILAYFNQSFATERLHANLNNLRESLGFRPDSIVIDGLDFEKAERPIFLKLKEIAREFSAEIWLSALSHRHILEVNERGIPYPCNKLDDIFSLIVQLQPEASTIHVRLLKDHDEPVEPETGIKLDPNTLLVIE